MSGDYPESEDKKEVYTYSEEVDFAAHREHIEVMDTVLKKT